MALPVRGGGPAGSRTRGLRLRKRCSIHLSSMRLRLGTLLAVLRKHDQATGDANRVGLQNPCK